MVVIGLEPPGVIEGGGGFPGSFYAPRRVRVVAHAGIVPHVMTDAAADQTLGLQFMDQIPEGFALLFGDDEGRIKP